MSYLDEIRTNIAMFAWKQPKNSLFISLRIKIFIN